MRCRFRIGKGGRIVVAVAAKPGAVVEKTTRSWER
jgi:hypothetical protein